jgi:hypothetical protein
VLVCAKLRSLGTSGVTDIEYSATVPVPGGLLGLLGHVLQHHGYGEYGGEDLGGEYGGEDLCGEYGAPRGPTPESGSSVCGQLLETYAHSCGLCPPINPAAPRRQQVCECEFCVSPSPRQMYARRQCPYVAPAHS